MTTIASKLIFACSVCYGDPNSMMTAGLNWAILSILIILAGIFAIFIRFIFRFKKRAQLHQG